MKRRRNCSTAGCHCGKRRNPDEDLRRLERLAASGDEMAQVRLLVEAERRDGAARALNAKIQGFLLTANGKRRERIMWSTDVIDLVRKAVKAPGRAGLFWVWGSPADHGVRPRWAARATYCAVTRHKGSITIGVKSGTAAGRWPSRAWGALVMALGFPARERASRPGYARTAANTAAAWRDWSAGGHEGQVRVPLDVAHRWLALRERGLLK